MLDQAFECHDIHIYKHAPKNILHTPCLILRLILFPNVPFSIFIFKQYLKHGIQGMLLL